jgi:hypothetical protein
MKSEHRHQLESNALAQRLDVAIERIRPYASTIAGVVVAVVVIMFVWSYVAGSSSARQSQAWDTYNLAVAESIPDVDQLRQTAQDHPGTKLQQLADVTWADSQVWTAARDYIYNRSAAMEALTRATSAYQGVLQSSDDERLKNRAQLGLARIYELQGKLDEARNAYSKVQGGYAPYAKLQVDRLAQSEAKDTYAWLATARPPLPRAPLGPGTPGQRPDFSEGQLTLPGTEASPSSPAGTPPTESLDDLLKGLDLDFNTPSEGDRYAPGTTPPATEGTSSESTTDTPSGAPASADNSSTSSPASSSESTPLPSTNTPQDDK